ncbi:serine hydrolase domain-containing protein [Microlunatus speluncae]|uniref:serine hydrolase domain-containing protein n=1 Tax=Microlunatus speluncae TaxID=2594267 RepID=UPI001266291A|nr:serine hydrolase domain-containing protein [Microlunatus speluncae]
MFSDDLNRRLGQALRQAQSRGRVPSVVAGVVRGGELAWAEAVGSGDGRGGPVAGTDWQYRIGSLTKTFVAVGVLRLADEGLLDLHDQLEQRLPGTPIGQVRIIDLLGQCSGIRAETESPWWERSPGKDWPDLEAQLALRGEARGLFHYSNVGFGVLGRLITELRGRPWPEALAAEILAPLGMTRTTIRPQPPHATGWAVHPHSDLIMAEPEHDAESMGPAGQLWSTVDDLGRWAHFLHAGNPDVLSEGARAAMRIPRALADLPEEPWTSAYGLGLQIFNVAGRRRYGHGGSMPGFLAALRLEDNGDAAIILGNTTAGLSSALADALLDLVAEHAPPDPPVWTADAAQSAGLELTGTWYWGPAPFELRTAAEGWLELRPHGYGRGSRFRPDGDDRWIGLDGYYLGEPLVAVRRDGRVHHWDLASFRLTSTPYAPDADLPGGVTTPWS